MPIYCNGITFDGPYEGVDDVDEGSGVYVILNRDSDAISELRYVGETDSFPDRISKNHEKYDCWIGSGGTLYHGLYHLDDSTKKQRVRIERHVIDEHQPVCNRE